MNRFCMTRLRRRFQKGSALIAVFFLIAILGLITFSAVTMLKSDTGIYRALRGRAYAAAQAESGLAIGMRSKVKKDDPLLHQGTEEEGFDVVITTEEAKLNINSLILQQPSPLLLRRLLRSWNYPEKELPTLLDTLKDWVDDDSRTSLNGAEKMDYERLGVEGIPFNRTFADLKELLLVPGFEKVAQLYPNWLNVFTVFGDGKVDLNEADVSIVAFLAMIPPERADVLSRHRLGRDGEFGTKDDVRLTSVAELIGILGIGDPIALQQLTQWGKFDGAMRRVESIGYHGNFKRRLVLISKEDVIVWRGEIPIP